MNPDRPPPPSEIVDQMLAEADKDLSGDVDAAEFSQMFGGLNHDEMQSQRKAELQEESDGPNLEEREADEENGAAWKSADVYDQSDDVHTATDDPSQETLDRRFWVAAADHDVEAMDAALEAGADIE